MTTSPVARLRGLIHEVRMRTLIRTRLKHAVGRALYNRCGYEIARDAIRDLRYGGWCGGFIPSRFYNLGAHGTRSTHYHELERIFSPGVVDPKPDDVLVDIGSGKGRVLNFWLERFPRNQIIGIELDEAIADRARHRLRRWKNVRIITGDAVDNIPPEGTIYWMFNPFKEPILRSFGARLKQDSSNIERVKIVYYRTLFVKAFEDDPFWSVRYVDLKLWESSTGARNPRALALIEAAR